MQNNGIVRKVDELGRIVLPIEVRRIMGIAERDSLVISMNENEIEIRKYEPICLFCGSNQLRCIEINIRHAHARHCSSQPVIAECAHLAVYSDTFTAKVNQNKSFSRQLIQATKTATGKL
jgi:transcriptional pleiotropic regulator of transition state genes